MGKPLPRIRYGGISGKWDARNRKEVGHDVREGAFPKTDRMSNRLGQVY